MHQRAFKFTCSYILSSERFFLVFWPEEDAVTTVAEGNIVKTLAQFNDHATKTKRKLYIEPKL